jgi:hypothetical protein
MALGSLAIQVLAAGTTTYTPTANMAHVLAFAQAGGGAGGEAASTDSAAGGGGEGGRAIGIIDAAVIGASEPCAIGTAGNATTLGTAGAILNATGGSIGVEGTTALGSVGAGGAAGNGAGGGETELFVRGEPGWRAIVYDGTNGLGGAGGGVSGGGPGGSNVIGGDAAGFGCGGAGGHASATQNRAGGAGSAGVLFMLEFIEESAQSQTPRSMHQFRMRRA